MSTPQQQGKPQQPPPQQQQPPLNIDRYVVMHVATTCDEHGVYVTKDSAEVIELGWILLDANSLEEVRILNTWQTDKLAVPPPQTNLANSHLFLTDHP